MLFDGHDIREYDLEYLRSQIGIVPQNGILFEGTILENMTLYREGDAIAQAVELSRMFGLDEIVSRLPEGLDTRVGGAAVDTLAEGVRQKIIMVRSLVGMPPVILFDDANANFDLKNDNRLQRVIETPERKAHDCHRLAPPLFHASLRPPIQTGSRPTGGHYERTDAPHPGFAIRIFQIRSRARPGREEMAMNEIAVDTSTPPRPQPLSEQVAEALRNGQAAELHYTSPYAACLLPLLRELGWHKLRARNSSRRCPTLRTTSIWSTCAISWWSSVTKAPQ